MHDVGASSSENGPNTLYPADPVDLGAQSDLIGALEPISIEALLAAQIGGYGACDRHLSFAEAARTPALRHAR